MQLRDVGCAPWKIDKYSENRVQSVTPILKAGVDLISTFRS